VKVMSKKSREAGCWTIRSDGRSRSDRSRIFAIDRSSLEDGLQPLGLQGGAEGGDATVVVDIELRAGGTVPDRSRPQWCGWQRSSSRYLHRHAIAEARALARGEQQRQSGRRSERRRWPAARNFWSTGNAAVYPSGSGRRRGKEVGDPPFQNARRQWVRAGNSRSGSNRGSQGPATHPIRLRECRRPGRAGGASRRPMVIALRPTEVRVLVAHGRRKSPGRA